MNTYFTITSPFGVATSIIMVGIGVLYVIGMAMGPAVSIILVSALISFSYREKLSWGKRLPNI